MDGDGMGDGLTPMIELTRRDRYDSLFRAYASAYALDWRLLKSQAIVESSLDPRAISRCGAEGLTQFMPATFKEIAGTSADPFNPEHAIAAQAIYMRDLGKMFPDDPSAALAAYNAGPGRLRELQRRHGGAWLSAAPTETRAYVSRVLSLRAAMREDG